MDLLQSAPGPRGFQEQNISVLRRRLERPWHCWSAANDLAMQHLDIAGKVAANLSRRTGHPYENLHQIVVMGIIEASRR